MNRASGLQVGSDMPSHHILPAGSPRSLVVPNRACKSRPFRWSLLDVWDWKTWIIFWSQSLYASAYTCVFCGFKLYFFLSRVWPFIVQLKAVEKTRWERLHVRDVTWNSPHAPAYNGFHLFQCRYPPLGKKVVEWSRETSVPEWWWRIYHSRREQRRAVVHKAPSHKT